MSYDSTLADEVSWVRFLIRDTDLSKPLLADEEISAVLARQTATAITARRYYAAAECLRTLHAQFMTAGRGRASKRVSQLQIVYGSGGINTDMAIKALITDLRAEASRLEAKGNSRPFTFRTSRGF